MKSIKIKARAKINVALDVVGRRQNGYHDVRMVMQTIDLYDRLEFTKVAAKTINLETNLKFLPTDDKNLVVKVAKYMIDTYGLSGGLDIKLHKRIPVAAGLAGGSTDAAATIKGINKLFRLNLSMATMAAIGVQFGADIPYCLYGGSMLAEGIGEVLTPLPAFLDAYVVIVKPGFGVSTPQVFQDLQLDEQTQHPDVDLMIVAMEEKDLKGIVTHMGNVLESVTMITYPVIKDLKDLLLESGACGALMSGSGPTVFGLFDTEDRANQAKAVLRNHPEVQFAYVTKIDHRKRD